MLGKGQSSSLTRGRGDAGKKQNPGRRTQNAERRTQEKDNNLLIVFVIASHIPSEAISVSIKAAKLI